MPPRALWYIGEIIAPRAKWDNEKMLPPRAIIARYM